MSDVKKPMSLCTEVLHHKLFARYNVQTNPSDVWKKGATLIGSVDTTKLAKHDLKVYEEVVADILNHKELWGSDEIWFKKVEDYVTPDDSCIVNINDTNNVLFNTPVNLMLTAACTKAFDVSYYNEKTNERIVRLIRYAMTINIHPTEGVVGAHMCNLYGDSVTVNDINPRTIQFSQFVQLLNCTLFKREITNGNLMLAFADIYYNNLDDDVIDINDVLPDVTVRYDQFTGDVCDNHIQLDSPNLPGKLDSMYAADLLDSGFVEFLQDAIGYVTLKKEQKINE